MCDWSSYVCSSDLPLFGPNLRPAEGENPCRAGFGRPSRMNSALQRSLMLSLSEHDSISERGADGPWNYVTETEDVTARCPRPQAPGAPPRLDRKSVV